MAEDIGIIGCGWLGLPLAKNLAESGYRIVGTTTREEKLPLLAKQGIDPCLYILGDEVLEKRLLTVDTLIITIPPSSAEYHLQLKQLLAHYKSGALQQIIYCSSTSVYGDQSGELDESAPLIANVRKGHFIKAAEEVMQDFQTPTTILRLGGLVGPNRHPIRYLSGRSVARPQAAVNLIHQVDVIDVIQQLIGTTGPQVFNVVADQHPSRKEYYTKVAERLGVSPPLFADEPSGVTDKIILNNRLLRYLGRELRYSNPFDFPEAN